MNKTAVPPRSVLHPLPPQRSDSTPRKLRTQYIHPPMVQIAVILKTRDVPLTSLWRQRMYGRNRYPSTKFS